MPKRGSTEVLIVSKPGAQPGVACTMAEAKFLERSDLQAWLIDNPNTIEPDFYVLFSEVGSFETTEGEKHRDRLDICGVDVDGNLTVVELKRGSSAEANIQGVGYAALVKQFTVEHLAEYHKHYLRQRGDAKTIDEVRSLVAEKVEVTKLGPLNTPRIIIIAEAFAPRATNSAALLASNGISITLLQYALTRFDTLPDGSYVLSIQKLFPPREMSSSPVNPVVQKILVEKAATVVSTLIDQGAIKDGTLVNFAPRLSPDPIVTAWVAEDSRRGTATWINNKRSPLAWAFDEKEYTPTGLVQAIYSAAGIAPKTVRGPEWWSIDGRSLVEIAGPIR